jgi:hypothetical protein
MKIPSRFRIEGKIWAVEMKWRIDLGGAEALGLTMPQERKILLVHGMKKDEQLQVFIHEVIHAILAEKGLYIAGLSGEMEEIIAHGLSKELCNIFSFKVNTQGVK